MFESAVKYLLCGCGIISPLIVLWVATYLFTHLAGDWWRFPFLVTALAIFMACAVVSFVAIEEIWEVRHQD